MIQKVALSDLSDEMPPIVDLFVCTASFESRCSAIAKQVVNRVSAAVVVTNNEATQSARENFVQLCALFEGKLSTITLTMAKPIEAADALHHLVAVRMCALPLSAVAIIDVTTFTHEQLLILLALLNANRPTAKILLAYNGASEYSWNTAEEDVWLTRGVRGIRSILGYPGSLMPTRQLHLVLLVGFEVERAQALIEAMEPAYLSLGHGHAEHSVSPEHYARNMRFLERLKIFVDRQENQREAVSTFEFSCVDPYLARDAILNQAAQYPRYNTVVSPLNTKLSSVGAGLAALQDHRIQLIYAAADEYNEEGYSKPGPTATLVELDFSNHSSALLA